MVNRADIQSFDFRSLLVVQEKFPQIRTVYLFGDFPVYADPNIPGSGNGTNLQDEDRENTPWLADVLALPFYETKQPSSSSLS
jgi:glycerophosphoryl diester phosphodiesterase